MLPIIIMDWRIPSTSAPKVTNGETHHFTWSDVVACSVMLCYVLSSIKTHQHDNKPRLCGLQHLNGKTAGCVCTNKLRAEDEDLDFLKFSPAEIQIEVLSVCDEETLVVKTPFALKCFYFLKSIAEGLDTNLPCWMSHGGELPGFLERLHRNIHAHIPENLCNLRGEGWKKVILLESSIYNVKIFFI